MYKLGTYFGVPVQITRDTIWPILFSIAISTIAGALANPWSPQDRILVSLLWIVGVFGSLLLHEYAHVAAAKASGYQVEYIEINLIGGYCLVGFPDIVRVKHLIRLYAAGPVINLTLSLLAIVAMTLCFNTPLSPESQLFSESPFAWYWMWIGIFNIYLSLMNFTPWRRSSDALEIERILMQVGWSVRRVRLCSLAILITYLAALVGTIYGCLRFLVRDWTAQGLL